jgi:hypothetical protein
VIKPRNATELAIVCATGLIALGLVGIAFHSVTFKSTKPVLWLAMAAVLALGLVVGPGTSPPGARRRRS